MINISSPPAIHNRLKKYLKQQLKRSRKASGLAFITALSIGFGSKQAAAQIALTASAGTTSATYTTINDAFAAINAGTHTGTINITVTANTTEPATPIPLLASGTGASSYSSINIVPSGNVTINSAATPVASRGIIELTGADNVTINGDDPATAGSQNLSIVASTTGSNAGVACIRLSSNSTTGADGANNISIQNCIITGARSSASSTTTSYGIQFSNGTGSSSSSTGAYGSINTLIENNTITRAYFGINAIGSSATYLNSGLIIRKNIIGSATSANNIGVKGIVVSYTASTAGTGSAVISGNDIRTGSYTDGFDLNVLGLELASTNAGCLVNANNVHDISQPSTNEYGAYGILVSSGSANSGIRMTNNFIRDCKMVIYLTSATSAYIPCGVYFTGTATNVIFNNNTVVMNDQLATSTSFSSFCVNASTSGVTFSQFLNNVLVNNHASSNAFAFYTGATSALSSAVVNNNDYYVNAASNIGYYNGAARASLPVWKAATGKDSLSLNYNPTFVSATDLHIPAGSISFLESAGASVAITGVNTDFDNQTRPGASTFGFGTAPDMGADEFDGNVVYTCTTSNPGATLANTPICYGSNTTLSLTTPGSGTGLSYQWQASSDNITYVDSLFANSATYTITPTKSAYYRCKVTCMNGPATTYSTPIQINFAYNVTATTPATRCGLGTATLAATGSTGSTLKWYASATDITPLATGSTYTTPVITATTNYYVAAESSTSVSLGAGANTGSSYDAIFYHLYGGAQSQFLIRASELQAVGLTAGNINSIAINMSSVSSATYAGFAVSIGTTTNTNMAGGLYTGTLNNVFNAASYAPTTGINIFPFSTPLTWDGTSNIIVKFCWSNNNSGGTGNYAKMDNVGYAACAYHRADNQTSASICSDTSGNGTTNNRPQFLFNVCASPRVMVTATVTPAPTFTITTNQTVCNGAATPLTVTSTAGNFNNYTWAPTTNLFTDAAATIPYTGTSASTVYAKLNTVGTAAFTANALNTTSQCAAVTSDTLTVMPNNIIATANPSNICVSGTATFTLAPATGYGAGTFQWQSSTDNNTFSNVATGGTAITYTTPVTTSTTYYRAVIKNSAGTSCYNSSADTARVLTPTITATTPATRCDTGSLTLTATGIDGDIKWYAAATGNTPLATGNTFTTPSLTNTTTYYVASEAPAGSATFGTGTTLTSGTGYPTAFGNRWYQDWSQMVYTASELAAAGLVPGYISGIKLNIAALGSSATVNNYTISLGSTTSNTLTAFTQNVTAVFGPSNYTSAVGINTITFTTPYYWDGTSNIILDIRGKGINSTYNATTYYTTTSGATVVGAYSSSDNAAFYTTTPTSVATSTSRLNVIFDHTGCASARTPVIATVNPLPIATTTPTGTVAKCEGTSTTITANGTGNYQWINNGGIINGQTNNVYTPTTAATYKVVVTNPTTGCKDTSDAITVYDKLNPVVQLGNDTVFCSGPSLVLNAHNAGSNYLWDNFSVNQTRTVNASGNYFVKVTDTANCFTVDTIAVVVNPTPIVNLGNDTNLCLGTNFILDAANTGSAYLWDNGTTAQTRTVNNTGNYAVRVTNTYNCTATDSVTIHFLSTPTIDLGNNIDACNGITTTLNAGNQGGITTYLWDNGSTQSTRNVVTSGTYYVTVGNIANCKSSDTIKVDYHANPVVNLGNDTTICHDITITLDAQNPGAAYLWNNGSTNQTRNVNATGLYEVTVTDAFACKGSDAIQVTVTPLPSGVINAVHGDTATYTFNVLNAQNVTGYVWNFGDGTTATGPVVQHTYTSNGQYVVSVTFAGMCNDSAVNSRTVEVYDVKTTGIHQINADKELKLYPNPATEMVVIENVANLSLQQITVYNVIGQKVYDEKADNKVQHKMNTSRFASGIYTVRIETSAGTVIRKFEIQK